MPKIEFVSQAELAAVLVSYNALGHTILGIRRRLEAGAAVEEGIYTAQSNPGDPISGYDHAMNDIGLYGLDLETKGLPSDVYQEPVAQPDAEPEIPEWATSTPLIMYQLEMSDEFHGSQQTIDLTREEYVAVKEHLARLRGIDVPAKEAAHAH